MTNEVSDIRVKNSFLRLWPYVLFLLLGLLFRFPYYTQYFVPGITGDSLNYADFARRVIQHVTPSFNYYTPGYPVFLWLTHAIGFNTLKSFFLLQTGIDFLIYFLIIDILFGMRSINRNFRYFILLVLLVFFNSSGTLSMETTMNPVPIYTSLSILLVFIIVKIIRDKDFSVFKIAGAAFVFCLLITLRPQSVVFLPLFLFMLFNLLVYSKYKRAVVAAAGPVLVFILIGSYNYYTLGTFSYSSQQFVQKVRSSVLFVEKKDNQPLAIQSAVDSLNQSLQHDYPGLTREQIIVASPGIMDEYGDNFVGVVARFYNGDIPKPMMDTIGTILHRDRNSGLYMKKIISTFKTQISDNSLGFEFYLTDLKDRIFYISKSNYYHTSSEEIKRIVAKDYYPYFYQNKPLAIPQARPHDVVTRMVFLINTRLSAIIKALHLGYIYMVVLLTFAMLLVFRFSKFLSVPKFLTGFLIALIPLANYLLISLFVYPGRNYSYTSDFFIMIAPLLLLELVFAD